MSQQGYSNTYWHFTGSPSNVNWSDATHPKDILTQGSVLSDTKAANNLHSILTEKTLKATCVETILQGMDTEEFCCVMDVPIRDLPSYSSYYGKVVIGFKAAAIRDYFVPVLYLPEHNLQQVEEVAPNKEMAELANNFLDSTSGWAMRQSLRLMTQAAHNIEALTQVDKEVVENTFVDYVKMNSFDADPLNNYYREREWRCLADFKFKHSDIDAIVMPEKMISTFRRKLDKLKLTNVNLLSWEFIGQL